MFQIMPVSTRVKRIPGRRGNASFELIFHATDIPPLGFKSYHISKNPASAIGQMSMKSNVVASTSITNGEITIKYDNWDNNWILYY